MADNRRTTPPWFAHECQSADKDCRHMVSCPYPYECQTGAVLHLCYDCASELPGRLAPVSY